MTSEGATPDAHRLAPEDQARADFYALLARLYGAAPDASLLTAIAASRPLVPEEESAEAADDIASTWESLRAASAAADPTTVADEFQALFIGVGKSEVSLYASHYLGRQSGRPLAELRNALADLRLARRAEVSEFEDHLSIELEIMRMLVAGDAERPPATIDAQHAFYDRYLLPWVLECCIAISQSPIANYYLKVAKFSMSFLALERDSFAIE